MWILFFRFSHRETRLRWIGLIFFHLLLRPGLMPRVRTKRFHIDFVPGGLIIEKRKGEEVRHRPWCRGPSGPCNWLVADARRDDRRGDEDVCVCVWVWVRGCVRVCETVCLPTPAMNRPKRIWILRNSLAQLRRTPSAVTRSPHPTPIIYTNKRRRW